MIFKPDPITIVLAIISLLMFTLLFVALHEAKMIGAANAVKEIQNANEKATTIAESAQRTVEDCYRSGGLWDRSRGVCKPPGTSQ